MCDNLPKQFRLHSPILENLSCLIPFCEKSTVLFSLSIRGDCLDWFNSFLKVVTISDLVVLLQIWLLLWRLLGNWSKKELLCLLGWLSLEDLDCGGEAEYECFILWHVLLANCESTLISLRGEFELLEMLKWHTQIEISGRVSTHDGYFVLFWDVCWQFRRRFWFFFSIRSLIGAVRFEIE